jgi:N-acyl-D-amino-acid deacylase
LDSKSIAIRVYTVQSEVCDGEGKVIYRFFTLTFLSMGLIGCGEDGISTCVSEPPGSLITNVEVVDGSGSAAISADVRINNGLISDIGDLTPCNGETVVDGGGHTLAPGFIDTHSHADGLIFEHPDALSAVSQGITTVIVGQDGDSPYPLADFYSRLESRPASVNVASYAGHNTIRELVLGEDFRRVATADEIGAMSNLLVAELESGALGLATGLEYDPGIHSDADEVLALAKVTATAGGRYISHIRSEDRWLEDAVDEIIMIGRETGMPVQISHIKLAMKRLWGKTDDILEKLDVARAQGVKITADIYPYEYWQSTMMVMLPDRDYTDRDAIAEVLDQLAPPEGMWMTRFDPQPEYVGKTLIEIAALRETDPVSAFSQLAEEADLMQRKTGKRAEAIIGTSMTEADIGTLMSWSETNICTDGGLADLHPRGIGSFPRVLGRYVREQKLMTLETAVHKMSGLAAEHMGFTDRGLIRQGAVADLVLFDPDTVIDRATPEDPDLQSEGITAVWVAGELVFENGATTDARPGKVIRRLTSP